MSVKKGRASKKRKTEGSRRLIPYGRGGGKENSSFFVLSRREQRGLVLKGLGVMLLVNYCFYRSSAAFFFLLPIGIGFYQMEKRELMQKKKEEARWQFKEMLLLVTAGQRAGYSVENAFLKSYGDLAGLFGENSSICLMLHQIRIGLDNRIPIGELWKRLGEQTDIAEIKEFAGVFSIAKESGGNMTVIMERTAEAIEIMTETQREIETLLSAGRLEQRLMNGMPFGLILYISITSPGYFDGLYYSAQGRVIMTFALVFYVAVFWLGTKIAEIKGV